MVIKITVLLKGHEVPLSIQADRAAAYHWVLANAADIDAIELDCGLNDWSWSSTSGWVQYPKCKYTPGKGMHPASIRPVNHGNGYDARHPWKFCMAAELTPNPLCNFNEFVTF